MIFFVMAVLFISSPVLAGPNDVANKIESACTKDVPDEELSKEAKN